MARFEELVEVPGDTLDREVHERVIVDGTVGRLQTPVIHANFKGLETYNDQHSRCSTWEAHLRRRLLSRSAQVFEYNQPLGVSSG